MFEKSYINNCFLTIFKIHLDISDFTSYMLNRFTDGFLEKL